MKTAIEDLKLNILLWYCLIFDQPFYGKKDFVDSNLFFWGLSTSSYIPEVDEEYFLQK
jgi:hypothetical protein